MQKSLKRNFIISLIKTMIVSVTPIIIFPYAARILGTSGIGKVQYIQSVAGFFQIFASFGITTYGIREGAKLRDDNKKLGKFTTELILINLFTTILTLIMYSFLFKLEEFYQYKSLLILFAGYIFSYGMNLDWFFNAIEEYTYITKRTAIFYFIAILVMLFFLKTPQDAEVYAIVLILPYIGMFFTNLFQIHKKVHLFPKEKYAYKIHFKSIFWFFAINISVNIYVLLDTVMLGFLSNDSSVGLYSAAAKLSRTVVSLIASMCTTFIPRLSYYAGMQKIDEYQSLLDKTAKIVLFLSIPASLGLFVLSKEAIILYSGINFIDSIPSMRLFSLFLSLSIINNFLGSQILLPNNKEKLFFLATLVGAISDIIFNFLLIPRFNYMGATIATFTSEIVVFIICYHGAKEYLSTKKLLKQLIKYFLASIPIPCIAYIMRHLFTSTVIISISTCICSIILYCFLLFIMKDDVMQYINSIILKHIKK